MKFSKHNWATISEKICPKCSFLGGKKASWTLFFQNILTNPMISEISFLGRHTYKNNFFTRTVKEWNTLPSFLLDQPSVDEFKSAVTNYFNLPWFYTSFYFIIHLFLHIHSDGKPLGIITYK